MFLKTAEVAAGLDDETKSTTGYFLNFIDFISAVEKANCKQITSIIPSIFARLSEITGVDLIKNSFTIPSCVL